MDAVPWDPLVEVDELADHELYADALSLLTRFFETSRDSAADAGVRLSFALDTWHRLAERYPPAGDALLATRDRARDRLLARAAGRAAAVNPMMNHTDFAEVASINRELDRDADTCDFFDQLATLSPEIAEHCWFAVNDALLRCGRPGVG